MSAPGRDDGRRTQQLVLAVIVWVSTAGVLVTGVLSGEHDAAVLLAVAGAGFASGVLAARVVG